MKKLVLLSMLFAFIACSAIGCADIAGITSPNNDQIIVDTGNATFTEEGYYILEGTLCELDKTSLSMKTADGHILYFNFAPETVIYSGEDSTIEQGQKIKIVFDGDISQNRMTDVSVIMVSSVDM